MDLRDEPDGTEELRVGREPVPHRLRRPGAVVAVALAGLAAAWVTTRLDSGGVDPAPSTAVSSPSLPGSSPRIARPVPYPAPATRVPVCPASARCRSTTALPAAVGGALRDNYPAARVVSSRTLSATGPDGAALLYRSIRAVAGARTLRIVVGPYVMGPDGIDQQQSRTTRTTTVDSSAPSGTVHLELREPVGVPANQLVALRLARDPRLAAQ